MSLSVSNASMLILLVLVSILLRTYGVEIGDECYTIYYLRTPKMPTPGTYMYLEDCPAYKNNETDIYDSNSNKYLLICCPTISITTESTSTPPTSTPSTSTPPTSTITMQTKMVQPLIPTVPTVQLSFNSKIKGSLAQAICAQNAKAVYRSVKPVSILNQNPANVSCALETDDLIFNNHIAKPKELPHMAALGFNNNGSIVWYCSGSLISANIVLTAAHCSYSKFGKPKLVKIGAVNLDEDNDKKAQIIQIKKIINHPLYVFPFKYHDIAILRLKHDVTYDEWVRPACLPVDFPHVSEGKVIAIGWNSSSYQVQMSKPMLLLKTMLDVIPNAICKEIYPTKKRWFPKGINDDWQICAKETKDICQRDSDGSLIVFNQHYKCMYNVIGITSIERFCSLAPGIYTKVYHYMDWIEETAWPEHF